MREKLIEISFYTNLHKTLCQSSCHVALRAHTKAFLQVLRWNLADLPKYIHILLSLRRRSYGQYFSWWTECSGSKKVLLTAINQPWDFFPLVDGCWTWTDFWAQTNYAQKYFWNVSISENHAANIFADNSQRSIPRTMNRLSDEERSWKQHVFRDRNWKFFSLLKLPSIHQNSIIYPKYLSGVSRYVAKKSFY